MRIFYRNFWEDLYYDTIWGVKNLIKYFKVIWNIRPWCFDFNTLKLFQFHLKTLLHSIENGSEIRENADLKILDIKRCLEILDNILEDDYVSKIGKFSNSDKNFEFEEVVLPEKGKVYRLKDDRTDEEKKKDSELLKASIELQNKEWEELWQIVSKGKNYSVGAMSWWD